SFYRSLATVAAVEANVPIETSRPALVPSEKSTGLLRQQSTTPEPNDPRYSSQWYLPKIGAPAAWKVTTGSSNIVVAVIDTGVDYTHPDLAANMWRNPGETGL